VSYLKDEALPEDKEEVRKLRVRAVRFVLMDEVLYKRAARSLVYKIVHRRYY